jgi:hypothetical protein
MNVEVTISLSEKWPFHSQYLSIFYDMSPKYAAIIAQNEKSSQF